MIHLVTSAAIFLASHTLFANEINTISPERTQEYGNIFAQGYKALSRASRDLGQLTKATCQETKTATAACKFSYDAGLNDAYINSFELEVSYLDGIIGEEVYKLVQTSHKK